ncbi:hypothetical protein [Lysobacter gummosus]|uniref:hypothetical protein n=1 Tax=Lysobacter gummosus TaxID=262324 RepID=UPI003645EEB1
MRGRFVGGADGGGEGRRLGEDRGAGEGSGSVGALSRPIRPRLCCSPFEKGGRGIWLLPLPLAATATANPPAPFSKGEQQKRGDQEENRGAHAARLSPAPDAAAPSIREPPGSG